MEARDQFDHLIQSVINDCPDEIITTAIAEQAIENMSVEDRYERTRLHAPYNLDHLDTVMEHLLR